MLIPVCDAKYLRSASLASFDSSPANALGASLGRGLLDASLIKGAWGPLCLDQNMHLTQPANTETASGCAHSVEIIAQYTFGLIARSVV